MTDIQVFETGILSAVMKKSFGINAKAVKSIQGRVPRLPLQLGLQNCNSVISCTSVFGREVQQDLDSVGIVVDYNGKDFQNRNLLLCDVY